MTAQDWMVGGHALPAAWPELLGRLGALAVLALWLALAVRALLRQRRYRARGVLGQQDLAALHAELAAAERRTVGEILVVVLERSDRHPGASWLAALGALLIGSVCLAGLLPWEHPAWLLLCQLALGAIGWATARWLPDFQRCFVTEERATEMAEEQALQEFHRHGLHRTEGRTGVLLFVSLLERRAVVLADEGIDARVGPEHWAKTDEAVLSGIRRGSLRDGLVEGIRSAGTVLAEYFPAPEGDRNEVPDRVIVRRE